MSCPNCKCNKKNKTNISSEEYEELKEYFQEEIQDYKVIDYIDDENKHNTYVEVEFEDYIIELDKIDTTDLSLDKVIDYMINNNLS